MYRVLVRVSITNQDTIRGTSAHVGGDTHMASLVRGCAEADPYRNDETGLRSCVAPVRVRFSAPLWQYPHEFVQPHYRVLTEG